MKNFLKAGPKWSGFFISTFVVAALTLVSCQTSPVRNKDNEPVPNKVSRTDGPTRSYLGLTKKEAVAKAGSMGLRSRIVRDGFERYPMTKDLRADRINFEIDKGMVTSAKIF